MSYYNNHIVLRNEQHFIGEGVKTIRYDCYLQGVMVGRIEWRTRRSQWEKPYEADTYYYDVYDRAPRLKRVGWFNCLFAAKNSLLAPGRAYIDSADEKEEPSKIPVNFLPAADREFYPTPPEVAGRLFAGIDWKKVQTVLEPNAGKGDLLELAINMRKNGNRRLMGSYRWSGDVNLDIDCVEIDRDLQSILIGKGFRVVYDDFLSYHTRKQYDLVLMNPPFSNGDKHLLHALELMENGGQIACILNAETIRNPYTNSRKALLKTLGRLGASIRFYDNGFAHAQRKADVDLAIINVMIPEAKADTSIWDGLRLAQEKAAPEAEHENELAPASAVERLLREYDLLCAAGIDLIRKYHGVSKHIMNGKSEYSRPIIKMEIAGEDAGNCDVNRFLTAARSRYWQELFDLPELKERMTSAMKDEYSKSISEMRKYEFSEFNIRQVIDKLMCQLNRGVEDAISKCFDKLSNEHAYHENLDNENIHYYNGWKTNKAHCVNMKCIIPTWGCFARKYKQDKHGAYRDVLDGIDARGCFQVLDDLEKALDYLDRGETTRTDLYSTLQFAAAQGRSGGIVCKYFEVTFYKKGTCHIKFYDQKIVDRLNIYVGCKRAWLPPSYGKVRYSEMDGESQRIVDEFMGREHYENVMKQPSNYIVEATSVPLLM